MAAPIVEVAPHQRRIAAQDQQVFGVACLRRPGEIVAAGDEDGVRLRDIDQQHLVVGGGTPGGAGMADATISAPFENVTTSEPSPNDVAVHPKSFA